jgi:hypothetical protein
MAIPAITALSDIKAIRAILAFIYVFPGNIVVLFPGYCLAGMCEFKLLESD